MTSDPAPMLPGKLARLAIAAVATALLTAVGVASCGGVGNGSGGLGSPAAPTDPGPGGTPPTLPGTLQSACFGWPTTDFSPANKASVATSLAPGQLAIDFTLLDTSGTSVRLSGLLASRPVLLVHGSFT